MTAEQSAFEAGRNYALYGANEVNCHFRHFATREQAKAWERGRDSIQEPAKTSEGGT